MNIQFVDDPGQVPRTREEVRFNQLGLFVYEDRRRVAVGFDISPFLERPSIQVLVINERDEEAAALSVIETVDAQFTLTLHLRDRDPTDEYRIQAILYYNLSDRPRLVVDRIERRLELRRPGEQ